MNRFTKSVLATLLFTSFFVGLIYISYSRPEWLVSMRSLSETSLQMIVITDKEEYNLGETINFTLCIANNRSYAIGMRPPNDLSISILNEAGQVEKTLCIHMDWVAYASIIVPPRSEHKFEGHPFSNTFTPKSKGTYTIHIELDGRQASTTIVVS